MPNKVFAFVAISFMVISFVIGWQVANATWPPAWLYQTRDFATPAWFKEGPVCELRRTSDGSIQALIQCQD